MLDKYRYKAESAATYGELGIMGTTYEMAFREAERLFGDVRGKNLLDFGSGTGRSTKFLKGLGANKVIGVDHNETMVAQARKTQKDGLEFRLIGDVIPVPDASFDGAFSSSVFLEFKKLDDIKKAMAEIVRVVKPGGIFIMTTANPEAFGHEFKTYKRSGDPNKLKSGDVTDCIIKKGDQSFVIEDVFWTEEDYKTAFESAGFVVEDVRFPRAEQGDWLDETRVAPSMVIKARKPV